MRDGKNKINFGKPFKHQHKEYKLEDEEIIRVWDNISLLDKYLFKKISTNLLVENFSDNKYIEILEYKVIQKYYFTSILI